MQNGSARTPATLPTDRRPNRTSTRPCPCVRARQPPRARRRAPPGNPMKLVLASTSAYRKMLLERLCIPFDTDRPETDETPLPGEAPPATAERLAAKKARAVAGRWPDALIIGSDQVAYLDDEVFG
ncbi:Maf family protein, partial [Arthrospira platensis SPKY1]|nr:Maf family protein [Arthrospira platensis SPKY1]